MVRVEVDFSEVSTLLGNVVAYAESGDPERVAGHTAKAQMLRRNEEGKDADGGMFDPYAESTKKRKKKRGRQTSPVNIRETGGLGESFDIDSSGVLRAPSRYDEIVEGITNDSRPGRPHRKFIGVTQKEADVQAKDIVSDMKRKGLAH